MGGIIFRWEEASEVPAVIEEQAALIDCYSGESDSDPSQLQTVRSSEMRNLLKFCIVLMAGALIIPFQASGQDSPQADRASNSLYNKLGDTGSGGTAPRRDLTGFWAGLVEPKLSEVSPYTPWGQEQARLHKSTGDFSVADSNDPAQSCDPLGFPRNMLFMTRGIAFAQMPGRVLELFQYDRLWREIWTDERKLPKNVGGDTADAPDPRWYGYSKGSWEDDYTFVVDTVGIDERSWLDNDGHPHSGDLRVQERYKRVDHNNLQVTITIDDPKTYTKPFVITQANFKWIPQQDFEEQLCVPSEQAEYLKVIGDPAAHGKGQ